MSLYRVSDFSFSVYVRKTQHQCPMLRCLGMGRRESQQLEEYGFQTRKILSMNWTE